MLEVEPNLQRVEQQPDVSTPHERVTVQTGPVNGVMGSVRSSIAKRAFLMAFLATTGATASVGVSSGCLQDFEKFRAQGGGAAGGSVSSVGGSGGKMENVGGSGASTSSNGGVGGMENVGGSGASTSSNGGFGGVGGMENVGGSGSSTGGSGGVGGMNEGGAGGNGGGCADIPVIVGDANGGEYDVKQYDAGCAPNGVNTLADNVFETVPGMVCVKNNGSLIVQTHDAATMNSLVIDSPVTPSKVEFFQLGVAAPISDAEADAYCTTNGTMVDPTTGDQDPAATGFEYEPGSVGQSNLWKITF
ncbi:hypothetical protein IT413_05090 [Candidatus Peregrinibacteria bacterium]|nr:hypothetical protein [Candidatus Peregrinibacteria bacterium]